MSDLRLIPLGGAGEIGKNCTVLEQGDDLIVIDCGISFPHAEQYGVDIVIPDFTYLIENKDRIKGLFITHAHEDHIGAISFLLPHINCPIYGTKLTLALIELRLDDRWKGPMPKMVEVKPGAKVPAGELEVEFVRVTHSIPETCALAIRTQHGIVLFTADFKFDFTPVDRQLTDMARLIELGQEGVLLLVSDSTNATTPGWGLSESAVTEGLRPLVAGARGRVLITTFSSHLHRMQQAILIAHEFGRKVVIMGRRMEQTLNLARQMEYVRFPRETLISMDEMSDYPPEQLMVLLTGSQGEPNAALSQMSRGEYRRLKVHEGDTIIFSTRPIPGNEGEINRVINNLVRRGANVITDAPTPIHASGHGYQDELKTMITLTKPFYLAPVHGEPLHQKAYKEMALAMGHAPHRIFVLDNGDPLELDEQKAWLGKPVTTGEVMIDQNEGRPIEMDKLRARQQMAHDGIVMVTLAVDRDGTMVANPHVEAHGVCGGDDVVPEIQDMLRGAIGRLTEFEMQETDYFRATIEQQVRKVLQAKTRQRPKVLTTVLVTK
ncbi:MAG TPA: ribonuclease J [Fimbriimonadaceae bacterium]|nr:ribonuclease J [Armatimonadota bacterium]HRD31346.1 ribonuclease J [Fimbriimonadaceae bacterium]HRE93823.1 ribonuclease J [Fimbriimonadaceae bacterium]HRI74212.1 ribonuclease J [Fimbriimonadaceae bacterium]